MSNRLRKKISNSVDYQPLVMTSKEYGMADLNWKDSGGTYNEPKEVEDPSVNDFIKGYNMDSGRYEFKQWASKNKKNTKKAVKEVKNVDYNPEDVAQQIINMSRHNGPIQDFFDGYFSNAKGDNDFKEQVANILNSKGYDVVPTYLDETPRYERQEFSYEDVYNKKNQEEIDIIITLQKVFPKSKIINRVAKEIQQLKTVYKMKVDKDTTSGLLDYYSKFLPNDYSKSLVQKIIDKPTKYFNEFRDLSLEDSTLNRMEQFSGGNQDFMAPKPNDGGVGGYNFPADFRGEGPGGVAPNAYEVRASKKKRL